MKRVSLLKAGLWAFLLSIAVAFIPNIAQGAVPRLIGFEGILRDGSGNPVANGSYFVTFKIYDGPGGGAAVLWSEIQTVTTLGGLFSASLGSSTALPDTIFNDSTRYLGIKVGFDPEMSPRLRLTSVGYSFTSNQWNSVDSNLYRLVGNVGIGTLSTPGEKLHVYSLGSSSSELIGVKGEADNTSTGNAWGGYFSTTSSGSGVHSGVVGIGIGSSSNGAVGGFFNSIVSNSSNCMGVQAFASNASTGATYGGDFQGTSVGGSSYGVSASGGTYGVYAGGNTGIFGGGGTYGVYGYSTGTAAVYGNIGGNFGTYGGYFQGDVKVERNLVVDGFIFKNGGGFKIDHPTDPANKYLYHSFVESPDMTNLYNGNITLDAKGEATVELPDWFGTLNKDFRYQLTAIRVPGPNLYIAEKVSNNRFRIAGGTAGMEVSWQVTGIRQDAYAKAHRIPVEEEKPAKERGKYLHPKEQGMPETLGMNYEETQKTAAEHKKMEEERKQQEEQRAKMEQERLIQEQKVKEKK